MEISPSSRTIVLGVDEELVSLNCSVRAHPLPLLQWSRNGIQVDGVQAATGLRETAMSILTVNVTGLGLGTYNFQCSATVTTPVTQSESAIVDTNLTVQGLLNINVVPNLQTIILGGNSNESDTVEFNCTVEASPSPSVVWLRNGLTVQEGLVNYIGGNTFFSSLVLTTGELEIGENSISCLAFLNNTTPPVDMVDMATVTISCM